MIKSHRFQRTSFSNRQIPQYKSTEESVYARKKANQEDFKHSMRKRGVIKGQIIIVDHPKKPWSLITRTKGRVTQITDYFFVVQQFPPFNYRECFLFADIMSGLIQIKGAMGLYD